ncbi:MAG: hypothetical protein CMA88_00010 [Euryarchaeota archaeon]|nr:hypothetical protein [Euryarchaeota archaeon]
MVMVAVFTFVISQIIPSQPAAVLCGERCGLVDPTTGKTLLEMQRERLGLDKPVTEQFRIYLVNLAQGDWGESLFYGRPTLDVVKDAAPVTLEMSLFALLIGYPIGISLGILSAVWQDSVFDHISRFMAIAFVSLPIFWLAMMLQLLFSTGPDVGGICDPIFGTEGGCLPLYGRHDVALTYPDYTSLTCVQISCYPWYYPSGGTGFHLVDSWFVTDQALSTLNPDYSTNRALFNDSLSHLILPSFTLGIASAGSLLRYMRASLLEVLNEDYVRTARAKGVSESRAILVHACRNALIPILTILGFSIGGAIGGAVLTESIFNFYGMGRVAIQGVLVPDFSIIMGVTLITAVIFLLSNLVVDILYAIVDPRVRLE